MQYRIVSHHAFDAVKAALTKPAPGAVSGGRSLLDALNYGGHFAGFRPKMRISAKRGAALPAAAYPLSAQQADSLLEWIRHEHPPSGKQPPAEQAEESALAGAQAEPRITLPPADDDPALASSRKTVIIHTGAGILVAIAVGLAIGRMDAFRLHTGIEQSATGLIQPEQAPAPLFMKPAPSLQSVPASPEPPAADTAAIDNTPAPPINSDPAPPKAASQKPPRAATGADQRQAAATDSSRARAERKSADRKPVERKSAAAASPPAPTRKPSRPAPSKPFSDDTPYHMTEAPRERSAYAACQRLKGIFNRERCAWRVCHGKWGKNGCPSYEHKAIPGLGTALAEDYVAARTMSKIRPERWTARG